MATPRSISYRVASGEVVYAGRFAPPLQPVNLVGTNTLQASTCGSGFIYIPSEGSPDWYNAIPLGEWGSLPNSSFSTTPNIAPPTHPGGNSNFKTLVTTWCGGILNTVGVFHGGAFIPGHFLVLFGGGHGDYAGNELYAYGPLESNTPIWRRLSDPSIPPAVCLPPSEPNYYNPRASDGRPVSRHTYDTLVYLPTRNRMLCIGAPATHANGDSFNISDIFDFSVDPYLQNPWTINDDGFTGLNSYSALNLMSGYNKTTGKAWGLGHGQPNGLMSFDAATLTWSPGISKANPYGSSGCKAGLDPNSNLLVWCARAFNAAPTTQLTVCALDLRTPSSSIYAPVVEGTPPPLVRTVLDYDELGQRFVAWADTGKTLYFLTPGANPYAGGDPWTWSSVTPAGGVTPALQTPNGTFGRFRMINSASLRGVLLLSEHNQPISFYRFS